MFGVYKFIVDDLPSTDRAGIACGGASLVELILDGKPITVDIKPFRFEGFAEGQLLEGEYGYGHIWK